MSELLTAATWLIYLVIGLTILGAVIAIIVFPFWLKEWRKMGREMDEMEKRKRSWRRGP